MTDAHESASAPRFQIFRSRDGRPYEEAGVMHAETFPPIAAANWEALRDAGYETGNQVTLLFSAPGFSLTHVWFKSGFPLPRHSHDADCLYYVVSGSLEIGTEILKAGDGFFVGCDVPYAYTPGEEGVEVLEFRTSDRFNIRLLAENPAFWARSIAETRRRQDAWANEPLPARSVQAAPGASD
jgi:quercetin dioxygenase-like cupin family protein